jgi:hypothetical protein
MISEQVEKTGFFVPRYRGTLNDKPQKKAPSLGEGAGKGFFFLFN